MSQLTPDLAAFAQQIAVSMAAAIAAAQPPPPPPAPPAPSNKKAAADSGSFDGTITNFEEWWARMRAFIQLAVPNKAR